MLNPQKCWTEMDLLPLVCLCVLTWSRRTLVDADGPLITKITIEEDNDVVLPCSFGPSDITNKFFDWKKDDQKNIFFYDSGSHYNNGLEGQDVDFRGRVSHFPDRLQSGDASIRINKVKVSDKGTYTCNFPHDGGIRSQIDLVVECILKDRRNENIPGSCPQPSVTTRKTHEGVLLECEVKHASPEPEVEWQDSDGNTVPSKDPQIIKNGNYSDIILLAAVTKEGDYQCVVKQTEICHQVLSKKTFVGRPGSCPQPILSSSETNEGMLMQCHVEGGSTEPEVELHHRSDGVTDVVDGKKDVSHKEGFYNVILSTIVTKEGDYWCVVKQREICHQVESKSIHVNNPGSCPQPILSSSETNEGMLMQCHVEGGSTEPEVELHHRSDGVTDVLHGKKDVSQKEGLYNVILSTIVTKKGDYWCVVKQREICHLVESKSFHVNNPGLTPIIVGVIIGLVFLVAVLVGIIFCLWKRRGSSVV